MAINELMLQEIAKGSKEALAQLYVQTNQAVYGFALSILKNKHDAEDVMQETYLKVYYGVNSYVSQGKPMAWILTITRNCALMKLRQHKKEQTCSSQASEAWGINHSYQTQEDGLILDAAMRVLSDEERQIIVLHAVAGFKHKEIALLLQLPLSTVLSKYQRGLKKLQKCLREESR